MQTRDETGSLAWYFCGGGGRGKGGKLLFIDSLKYNSNRVVEGWTVSHYYILVIRQFIYFMSLFRHSVWFSFSVKQFTSAEFGICNICSSVWT